jgi:hypothetical protein
METALNIYQLSKLRWENPYISDINKILAFQSVVHSPSETFQSSHIVKTSIEMCMFTITRMYIDLFTCRNISDFRIRKSCCIREGHKLKNSSKRQNFNKFITFIFTILKSMALRPVYNFPEIYYSVTHKAFIFSFFLFVFGTQISRLWNHSWITEAYD